MKNKLLMVSKSASFSAFLLFVVIFVVNSFVTKGFLSSSYINTFFASNAPLICLVIGSAPVIISGGIDLSVGGVVTLINVVMVSLFKAGFDIGSAVLIGVAVGLFMGTLNGLMIGVLRVNALMTTFATQSICSGISLWIMNIPGGSSPKEFTKLYNSSVLGIPFSLIVLLVLLSLAVLTMKSPLGVKIRAIGANEGQAFFSGISVSRVKLFVYLFSGLAMGIAGVALTGYVNGGDPAIGIPMTLTCVAACVIGGLDLLGGKGSPVGGIWGALFLQLIITLIVSLGVKTFQQDLYKGVIIFIGITGTIIVSNLKNGAPGAITLKNRGGTK